MSDDFTPEQAVAFISALPTTYRPADVAARIREEFGPRPPVALPTVRGTAIEVDGQWWLLDQDGLWKRGTSEFAEADLIERLGITEFEVVAAPKGATP